MAYRSTAHYGPRFQELPTRRVNKHLADVDSMSWTVSQAAFADSESLVPSQESEGADQHGPRFWLSVCSPPGVAWVCQQTGGNEFQAIAQQLISTWSQQLGPDRNEFSMQVPEPDPDLAGKYCAAYFEQSVDSVFGVVHRSDFESRFRAYLQGDQVSTYDPVCYALRNTIYASGCRILLSGDANTSFNEAQKESWRYFSNALSVYGELLFTEPTLLTVQALLAMTLYAEGLGSPALGYVFCANAARLALSMGLHRQPEAYESSGGSGQVQHSSWLFWAVYSCEKSIAQRTGRPSAIHDDEITCHIPTQACPGCTMDVENFTYIIQLTQISAQVSKQLMSVKACQQPPSNLLDTALKLDRQLRSWKDSLPESIRPNDHLRMFQMSQNTRPLPAILIIYAYYGTLMAIHALFTYPWSDALFGHDPRMNQHKRISNQMALSSRTVADAARSITVIARHLKINGACTQGFMLHYPMIALINLFIYVLKFPTSPTARADIALLDVMAGYFGHLDFATASELSFPFARDIAALARKTVTKASPPDLPVRGTFDLSESLQTGNSVAVEENIGHIGNYELEDWLSPSSLLVDDLPQSRNVNFDITSDPQFLADFQV